MARIWKGRIMHASRLSLAGIVTLALLGSMSGAAIAQEDAEAEYAAITGTMSVVRSVTDPQIVTSPTIPQESGTGWVYEVLLQTSDPRLAGNAVADHNYLAFVPGATGGRVWSVAGRLANDGGSWLLEGQGFAQPDKAFASNNHYVFRYVGQGGYEGLTAMTLALPTGMGQWDIEGVLFPGPMPDLPPPVEPQAQ